MVQRYSLEPAFPPGELVMTAGVADAVAKNATFAAFVMAALGRHITGDWGNLDEEDIMENERSLEDGFRLLSAYEQAGHPKIWIITEADRSVTTILFPEEY